jgi:erythromycin esterase
MARYQAGLQRASLALVALTAFALAACTPVVLPMHSSTRSANPVVRWIQQNAIPLRTVDAGGSDADLAALQQIVGHASIVGLGEETHGTHEFFAMKARLAEFLMAHLGFTTFIMENNWGASQLIDAYINGGPGAINTVMQAGLFGSWQTREYRALLEWMRAYNADPAHSTRIHFLGMDIQAVSQSDFAAVEQYVHQVAPQQAAQVQDLYAPLIATSLPNPYATYVTLGASTKQQYENQAQQVYDLLQAHQQDYLQQSSPQRFAFALQNARVIAQFATYFNAGNRDEALARYYQRDTFMAENVAWIYEHDAGGTPHSVVWAHDVHIANDTTYASQDGRNLGGELRARYQASYLAIGTTLYQGTFRTYQYPHSSIQQVAAPGQGTFNYTLGQTDLPLYLLDLDNVPPGPFSAWASGPAVLRNYGLGGEDLSTSCALSQWFDVIVHIQKTTPSTPI